LGLAGPEGHALEDAAVGSGAGAGEFGTSGAWLAVLADDAAIAAAVEQGDNVVARPFVHWAKWQHTEWSFDNVNLDYVAHYEGLDVLGLA